MKKFFTAIVLVLGLPGGAHAADEPASIRIDGAVIRYLGDKASRTGGFFRIINDADTPDTLLGASSPIARRAELHETTLIDDVMKMRPLPGGVLVPAHGTIELAPGGLHVMFLDLTRPPVLGERIPLVLRFAKASELTVLATVKLIGRQAH